VGVEAKLWSLDGETLDLVPAVQRFVAATAGRSLPGVLKTELHASVVELTNEIADTADEAVDRIAELRAAAAEIAGAHGLAVAAAGSHPTSRPDEQEIAPDERYREFVEYAGPSARRQGVSGLHGHVGMPTARGRFRSVAPG